VPFFEVDVKHEENYENCGIGMLRSALEEEKRKGNQKGNRGKQLRTVAAFRPFELALFRRLDFGDVDAVLPPPNDVRIAASDAAKAFEFFATTEAAQGARPLATPDGILVVNLDIHPDVLHMVIVDLRRERRAKVVLIPFPFFVAGENVGARLDDE
jgi:hypothetical protein